MKFLCERCGTRYSIADEKVRQKILKIRCKSCDNVITLRDSAADAPSAPAPTAPADRVASSPAARSVPPRAQGASLPAPPRPPPPLERAEWHLAVDGQQTGPFTKTQLASKVISQKPGAEIYVWKDGMDGWKEPVMVPEVDRAVASARQGRSLPPLPPPRTTGPQPLARLAESARPSASRPAVASAAPEGGQLGRFDEGEATQIQPLAAALAADVEGGGRGADAGGRQPAAKPVNGHDSAGKNGVKVAPAASADVAPGTAPAPFFPPPATEPPRGEVVSPAPLEPHMSAEESGISQVMGLGGRVSRKPALKYGAVAAGLLVVGGAVALAFSGGNASTGQTGAGNRSGSADKGARQSAEEAEKAAAAEAEKWFRDDEAHEEPKVAQVGSGDNRPGAIKRGPVARPEAAPTTDPTAPPPLDPPPAGSPAENAAPERKIADLGLQERRAIVQKKAPTPAASVDQSAIRSVVTRKENQDAVKMCYNRVLRQTGTRTGGRIEVVVTIGVSGKVKDVTLTSPPGLDVVHACLKTSISRWRFPASGEEYGTGFTLLLTGS